MKAGEMQSGRWYRLVSDTECLFLCDYQASHGKILGRLNGDEDAQSMLFIDADEEVSEAHD